MSYNIYSAPHELTSPKIAKALHQATGFPVFEDDIARDGNWMGFGSPYNHATLKHAQASGFDYFYGDHAYFERHKFYRLTKNALFHDGRGKSDGTRLRQFYRTKTPWRKRGRYVVLCPQSEGFFSRLGMTQQGWIDSCKEQIKTYTDRPIVIHHKRDKKPLRLLLKKAWIVVSHSSNSGLEAIMNGIPTITTAHSHVSDMSTKGFEFIEKPYYPDNRLEWAAVLADNQFTLEEIREGKANDLFR